MFLFILLKFSFQIFPKLDSPQGATGIIFHQESWIFVEEDAESQTSISTKHDQDQDENMRKCVGDNWIEVTDSSPIVTDVVQFMLSV